MHAGHRYWNALFGASVDTNPVRLFSEFSLDSSKLLDVPPVRAHSCQLIGPRDHQNWELQGLSAATNDEIIKSEDYLASLGAIPVRFGPGLVDRVRDVAPQGVDAAELKVRWRARGALRLQRVRSPDDPHQPG